MKNECKKTDEPKDTPPRFGKTTPGLPKEGSYGGHKKDGEKHSSDGKGHWSGH